MWSCAPALALHSFPTRRSSDLVQRYSLEEGLSQQDVNAIAQDEQGFMWFGTEDGLNRFDGYEFRQLRHDRADPNSIKPCSDRKSTRLNSSHVEISYAVFCLKKK